MKNIYLVLVDGGVTIIDPGGQVPLLGIKQALASIGQRIDNVRIILCTHYHFDHVGRAADLAVASNALVFAHRFDILYIRGKRRHEFPHAGLLRKIAFWIILSLPKPWYYSLTYNIKEGEYVNGLPGFKVLLAPGHTPGSICFYNESSGVIFTGDALQTDACPFTMDPKQEKISMDMIARLPVHTVLPGDGVPFIGDAKEKLKQFRL